MKKLVMIVALLYSLFACSGTNKEGQYPTRPELELHEAYSDELRSLMRRMDRLVHERELTAWDIDRIKKRRGEEINSIAANLVEVTDSLYRSSLSGKLREDEQREFLDLSQQLAIEAENVARVTRSGDSAEIANSYNRLEGICVSCHQQFQTR
jgi:cytochrome c556